jgi:cobalt/nickel transport system permease protein
VIVSAAAFALELAFSSSFESFGKIFVWMVLVHAAIAVGEALITGLVLRGVLWSDPELVRTEASDRQPHETRSRSIPWLAALLITAAVVVLLAPMASPYADGLEYVGERFGFIPEDPPTGFEAPLPDYTMPGLPEGRWSTVAAGLIGSVVVLVAGQFLTRSLTKSRQTALVGTAPKERNAST